MTTADPAETTEKDAIRQQESRGFGVLQFRNYRLFFIGQLISTSGMWMQSLAQGWLLVEMLKASPFELGLLPVFQFGPVLLLGIPAGSITDRFQKRNILLLTQVVFLILSMALAWLVWTDLIQLWHVYVLAILMGITTSVDMPTRQAFVSELVPKYALKNAIAINSATFNMGRILGPALAGLVLAMFGVAMCFMLNGLSYIAPMIGLAMMAFARKSPTVRGSGWENMKQGIAYVRESPSIYRPILLILTVGTFGMAYNVWLPLVATVSFQADEKMFGVLFASMGFGSLLGALSIAFSSAAPNALRMYGTAISLGVVTVVLAAVAVIPFSVWSGAVVLALSGFFAANTMAMANTLVQTNSPDELRGRVMAVYSTIFMGSTPIAGLIAGAISDRWGVEASMFVGGGIVAIVATLLLMLRRYARPVSTDAAARIS